MIENINWYPGHMKKTRELIQANLKMVDLVIEVIDARIPVSSRNPIINDLIGGKQRVIILNKMDLADNRENDRWTRLFKEEGHFVVPMNCMNGSGVSSLLSLLTKYQDARNEELSRKRTLRMMIVGVPNVGKSSLINRLLGKKSAKTGDRPGVTRGKQWLTLANGMQLLDTPGILWPKFEDPEVGLNLAFCGSIRDETMDLASLALELIGVLQEEYPEKLMERYKLIELGLMPLDTMEAIAVKRGFILSGKRTDYERTARTVLDEFRAGTIGKITLERCEE
ncbi:ribosome biogenesis GTPase YlqF [Aminipila terrae]|uniref:Ribosome biogenesis GTPase A n=1 Tax=Aminipila terrae TaxID=2697030 RepID=A0A6P1MCF5_9FIRM|nr:ribosome biogenesis GTPase YlqF [Aminipila terrae]QHI71531.1 ribosome biogenesis GTPase YlqF [Aminipila terrae]